MCANPCSTYETRLLMKYLAFFTWRVFDAAVVSAGKNKRIGGRSWLDAEDGRSSTPTNGASPTRSRCGE